MKAYVLHAPNEINMEEIDKPECEEGYVVVSVKAVGICGSDIPRIYKTGAHRHPLIPGHEFSGLVVETKESDAKWLGKRVGIFPLMPCRACAPCQKKQYEMCKNYNYLGSRCDGGFAEFVKVPVDNLIELPDNVTFQQAAMLEPMAVAVHAMRRAGLARKQTVVIYGIGTIGMLLALFLKDAGIDNILVIGNKNFQKEMIAKIGIPIECYCDSRTEDVKKWVKKHTRDLGPDVVFECIGKNETIVDCIEMAASAATVITLGNPYSDMNFEKNIYWKILRSQLTVKGTWNSSFTGEPEDDWHYVIERLGSGDVHPEMFITHRFKLENLIEGLEIMRDKSEDYVKIMGVME